MAERILEQLRLDGQILSYAEGRRLIAQGAVSLNGNQLVTPDVLVSPGDEIRVGKQKYVAGVGHA
jgi:ribosomal protein S4